MIICFILMMMMMTTTMTMITCIWMHQIRQMKMFLCIEVDNIMRNIQIWWQAESAEPLPLHVSNQAPFRRRMSSNKELRLSTCIGRLSQPHKQMPQAKCAWRKQRSSAIQKVQCHLLSDVI